MKRIFYTFIIPFLLYGAVGMNGGISLFYWDRAYGNKLNLGMNINKFNFTYSFSHFKIKDCPFHTLRAGYEMKLLSLYVSPGLSIGYALRDSMQNIIFSPYITLSYSLMRLKRKGDYIFTLDFNLGTELLYRRYGEAGIHISMRYSPIEKPYFEIVMKFRDAAGDGYLSGFENGELRVRLRNRSTTEALSIKVSAHISAKGHDIDIKPGVIPGINPGTTREVVLPVSAKDELYNGNADVMIEVEAKDPGDRTFTYTKHFTIPLKEQRKPKYPPELYADVEFEDTGNRDGVLDAGETNFLIVKIHNKANTPAYNLKILLTPLTPSKGITFPEEITVSKIDTCHEERIPIRADRTISTGSMSIKVEVLEPFYGADADPKKITFRTREFLYPDLALVDKGADGMIKGGKLSKVSFIIQNKGKGKAKDVRLRATLPPGVSLIGEERPEYSLGDMKSGEWKRIDMNIFVSKRYGYNSLPIRIEVEEKRAGLKKEIEFVFPVGKYIAKVDEKKVEAITYTVEETQPVIPVLTSDVDTFSIRALRKKENAIGVIVYVKDYREKGVPSAEYADRDAEIMRKYLIDVLGYKEENIIYLANPTKGELERVFGSSAGLQNSQLRRWVKPGVDVFVYYVGHGAPDPNTKKAYLVPSDCHPDYVSVQGYSIELLYDNLSKLDAGDITVVIDACFSGETEKGMIIAQASPLVVAPVPSYERIKGGRLTIITASKGSEISSWYPQQRHSLFTYYFLKALKGEADKNRDRKITIGEIKTYLNENVPYIAGRRYNRDQHPEVIGKEDKILVEYR